MLVLSRRKGQSIDFTVGDTVISVHVLAVRDKQVRIGIEAPDRVKVLRSELKDFNREERK